MSYVREKKKCFEDTKEIHVIISRKYKKNIYKVQRDKHNPQNITWKTKD